MALVVEVRVAMVIAAEVKMKAMVIKAMVVAGEINQNTYLHTYEKS